MAIPALIAGAGSLVAGGLNWAGAHQQNAANRDIAREQMSFQERMSSTAFQRAKLDMEAAGINPILAAGSQASSPGGASMAQQNELSGAVSSAVDLQRSFAEIANLKAQNNKIKADTAISNADAKILESQVAGALAEEKIDKSFIGPTMRLIQRFLPAVNSATSLMKGVFKR